MKAARPEQGFTLIETIAAVMIGAMVTMIAIPALRNVLDSSRLSTATHRLANDLWNARSKAVTTGWEYKIIGFGNTSTDTKKNQYRLLGRSSSGVAWPADTVAPFASATQSAGLWIDLRTLHEGILFTPGGSGANARFEIAFDSRGVLSVNTGDFNPFRLQVKTATKIIRVSLVGGVTTT